MTFSEKMSRIKYEGGLLGYCGYSCRLVQLPANNWRFTVDPVSNRICNRTVRLKTGPTVKRQLNPLIDIIIPFSIYL